MTDNITRIPLVIHYNQVVTGLRNGAKEGFLERDPGTILQRFNSNAAFLKKYT
jgi:hypothetical protein